MVDIIDWKLYASLYVVIWIAKKGEISYGARTSHNLPIITLRWPMACSCILETVLRSKIWLSLNIWINVAIINQNRPLPSVSRVGKRLTMISSNMLLLQLTSESSRTSQIWVMADESFISACLFYGSSQFQQLLHRRTKDRAMHCKYRQKHLRPLIEKPETHILVRLFLFYKSC